MALCLPHLRIRLVYKVVTICDLNGGKDHGRLLQQCSCDYPSLARGMAGARLCFVSIIAEDSIVTKWCLIKATDVDCTMDDSGVYTVINRMDEKHGVIHPFVRADLMTMGDDCDCLVSFIGTANNVRKRLIAYIDDNEYELSHEHISYIGYELMRAESDPDYKQD